MILIGTMREGQSIMLAALKSSSRLLLVGHALLVIVNLFGGLMSLGSSVARGQGAIGLDARDFGAKCGTSDSTSGIQAAATAASTNGIGAVFIACPMTVAGEVSLAGDVRLTGRGPMYYPGMTDTPGPAVWPVTAGPAINCTSTTKVCILVNGEGDRLGRRILLFRWR